MDRRLSTGGLWQGTRSALFRGQFVDQLAWPYLMAASFVTIFPVIVLFFVAQRTFVEGITVTGIKG